MGSDS